MQGRAACIIDIVDTHRIAFRFRVENRSHLRQKLAAREGRSTSPQPACGVQIHTAEQTVVDIFGAIRDDYARVMGAL